MTIDAVQDWEMVEARGDYHIYVRLDETGGWTYSLVWMPGPGVLSSHPGEHVAGPFPSDREAVAAGQAEIARRNRS